MARATILNSSALEKAIGTSLLPTISALASQAGAVAPHWLDTAEDTEMNNTWSLPLECSQLILGGEQIDISVGITSQGKAYSSMAMRE